MCYRCDTATWTILTQTYQESSCPSNWYETAPVCTAPTTPTNNTPTTGTILEMNLNEGTGNTANDISGQNNNGNIVGATWTDGNEGNALSFDGNDHVLVDDTNSLKITGQLTIEANIYPTAPSGLQKIISKRNGNYMYLIGLDGNKLFTCIGDGTAYDCTAKTTTITTNTWQQIKMTYSDTENTLKLYTNNELKETKTTTKSLKTFNAKLSIGADNQGTNQYYKGKIDQIKILTNTQTPPTQTTCYSCNTNTWNIDTQTITGTTCPSNWFTTTPTCTAPVELKHTI
jgi:hypothetical protein